MTAIDENWRFNPFTGQIAQVAKVDYLTISEVRSGLYGVQLTEPPLKKNANYIVAKEVTNADPVSPTYGTTYTEIDRTVSPGTTQYRVDYDEINADLEQLTGYYTTGLVEFNSSENGKMVEVTYEGTGRTASISSILSADATWTGDNTFSGANVWTAGTQTGLNIASGSTLRHNGNPVAGYLSDGAAFYRKKFNWSFPSGNTETGTVHGLSGMPNKLVSASFYISNLEGSVYYFPSDDTNPFLPVRGWVTSDRVYISRAVTGQANFCYAVLDYIL
jgi:hypothetical protein